MKTSAKNTASWLGCFSLLWGASSVSAAESQTPADLRYHVTFELGDTEFAPGDSITIQTVRGSQPSLAVGGTYAVSGRYTLESTPDADLSLFVTTTNSTPTAIDPGQTVRVQKGSGEFTLIKALTEQGYPHLSFYPASGGSSFGGVYFGSGQSVLRQKRFSYFDASPGALPVASTSATVAQQPDLERLNRDMIEYLGSPVAAPAHLDAAYSKSGLIAAIRLAAQRAHVELKHVDVDDSEFPYLVGVISGAGDFAKVLPELEKMKAYEHQGGVSTATCRAINIIPWRLYPSESSQRISRRLTVRENMFFEKLSQVEMRLQAGSK
jgi:hypothetical protein